MTNARTTPHQTTPPQSSEHQRSEGGATPWVMLALATLGFAVNFWAWALISPLGALYLKQGADSPLGLLSQSEVALMVAVPVIVGSLGRIIVGALTDRFGGRVMFPIVSAVTIVPVLFLAFFALDSYSLMLFGGFFLGIAGTAFAVGVPFVNAWFPPARRGLAVGIFGAGMGGTGDSSRPVAYRCSAVAARSGRVSRSRTRRCWASSSRASRYRRRCWGAASP